MYKFKLVLAAVFLFVMVFCGFTYTRNYLREHCENGDLNSCNFLLTLHIESTTDRAITYNNRGAIFYRTGILDKAWEDFNAAVKNDPDLATARQNLATICRKSQMDECNL